MSFREVRVFEVREALRLRLRGEGTRAIERADALDPQRADDVVDVPRRHSLHVALAHHLGEGLLGPPAGLEEPVREVAAPARPGTQTAPSSRGSLTRRSRPRPRRHGIGRRRSADPGIRLRRPRCGSSRR